MVESPQSRATRGRSGFRPVEASARPPALDFFAGSGLAAEALRLYFSIVWANDICQKKAATYLANHPVEPFHLGSVSDVSGRDLPPAVLSWASFPCQDLSLAGNLQGIASKRSGLVWQWVRIMDEMQKRPPLIVAENVVGLLSASNGQHYLALHAALSERGYRLGAVVLDAVHWIPQSRPRVFIIGVKKEISTEQFEIDSPSWCHNRAVQRIAKLSTNFVWWSVPQPRAKTQSLSDLIDFDAPAHEPHQSEHNLRLIPPPHRKRLLAAVKNGHAVFPGYKRIRNGRQVLELRFDGVAGCLRTPEGGSSRQVLVIHRNGEFFTRLLTVRETARLMGVRGSYRIAGSYNDGYKAMGDAVAVPVVRHLARYLLAPVARECQL